MDNKITSDEKLLKLIENSEQAKASAPKAKAVIKIKAKKFLRLPFKFNFRLKGLKLNLSNLEKGSFVLAGILTLIFFFNLASGAKKMNAQIFFSTLKAGSGPLRPLAIAEAAFLGRDEYLSEIKKRNIFLPQELRGENANAPNIPALLEDLKLVGIIWSNNPEAMIESTKENRTFLVKKGDVLTQHQIKVKEVNRASVIVEITVEGKTQEYELQ